MGIQAANRDARVVGGEVSGAADIVVYIDGSRYIAVNTIDANNIKM